MSNLGRRIKWEDENGWHTGRTILTADEVGKVCCIHEVVCCVGTDPMAEEAVRTLVKESCDGRLTWVELSKLQDWPARSEWEDNNLHPIHTDHVRANREVFGFKFTIPTGQEQTTIKHLVKERMKSTVPLTLGNGGPMIGIAQIDGNMAYLTIEADYADKIKKHLDSPTSIDLKELSSV